MAGEAGDVLLAVGELSIDFASHRDHHAGDVFLRVFVAGAVRYVTVVATAFISQTERSHEHIHQGPEVFGRKDFQVLRRSFGFGRALRGVLCEKSKGEQSGNGCRGERREE